MAISDRFLEQARIGKKVVIETRNKEIKGTILSLDIDSVGIQKEDNNSIYISLNSIESFECINENKNNIFELEDESLVDDTFDTGSINVIKDNNEANKEAVLSNYINNELITPKGQLKVIDNLNKFEQAIIDNNIQELERICSSGELYELGYSSELVDRINRIVINNKLPNGNSLYDISTRIYLMQSNFNDLAYKYSYNALFQDQLKNKQISSLINRICYVLKNDNRYQEIIDFYNLYDNKEYFYRGTNYTSLLESYDSLGKNGFEELKAIKPTFQKEIDYISLFKYLKINPNSELAKYCLEEYLKSDYVEASDAVLNYFKNQYDSNEFENLRIRIFNRFNLLNYFNELMPSLEIGHENTLASDGHSIDEIISEYLKDNNFGLIRAKGYLIGKKLGLYKIASEIEEYFYNIAEKLLEAKENKNDDTFINLLLQCRIFNIREEKYEDVLNKIKNDNNDLFYSLKNYNEEKLISLVNNERYLVLCGYSQKSILKFRNNLVNKAYPMGNSDYEIASRLTTWEFGEQALPYYEKVLNDKNNPKKENALNSIITYTIAVKDFDLFEKYYPLLNKKNSNNINYLQFVDYSDYYHNRNYKKLYEKYSLDNNSNSLPVLYGAYFGSNNFTEKETIISKILESSFVSYEYTAIFDYAKNLSNKSLSEYRKFVYDCFGKYYYCLFEKNTEADSLLDLDSEISNKTIEEKIEFYIRDNCDECILIYLYLSNKDEIINLNDTSEKYIIEKLKNKYFSMKYQNVINLCKICFRFIKNEDELENIIKYCEKGLEIYGSLPIGNDEYSIARRIMLIENNSDIAKERLINTINSSNNTEEIGLCGQELIELLNASEEYTELINNAENLLINKKIFNYSSIVYNLKNAYEVTNASDKKQKFISEISDQIESNLKNGNYSLFVDQVKVLNVIYPENSYNISYKNLIENISKANINLNENTFEGKANSIKYVDNDIDGYICFVLNGFENELIDDNNKNSLLRDLIKTCIENNLSDKCTDFAKDLYNKNINLERDSLDIIYEYSKSNLDIIDSINLFNNILEKDNVVENSNLSLKRTVLLYLERIYSNALNNNLSFDYELALKHLNLGFNFGNKLSTKLCIVRVLICLNRLDEAKEILGLISESSISDEINIEVYNSILDNYFNGLKSDLYETFNNLVKNNTLLNLKKHFDEFSKYITFSNDEANVVQIIENKRKYNVDKNNLTERVALIKNVYKNPLEHNSWFYLYFSLEDFADDEMKYCVTINEYLLGYNLDNGGEVYLKSANYIGKNFNNYSIKYKFYDFYNDLYRAYLMDNYKDDLSIKKSLVDYSKCNGRIQNIRKYNKQKIYNRLDECVDINIQKQIVKDYLDLIKIMDDGSDYVYCKSAFFLATNYNCMIYFYNLFREELIYKEMDTCLHLCFEMKIKSNKADEIIKKILNDLRNNQKYEITVDYILENFEYFEIISKYCEPVFPILPKNLNLLRTELNDYPDEKKIVILKLFDYIYENNYLNFKKDIIHYLQLFNDNDSIEDIYKYSIQIIQNTNDETDLGKYSVKAILSSCHSNKTERIKSIIDIYNEKSITKENESVLSTINSDCMEIMKKYSNDYQKIFGYLITRNWYELLKSFGCEIIKDINLKTFIQLNKDKFIIGVVKYAYTINSSNKDEYLKFLSLLSSVSNELFDKDITNYIDKFIKSENVELQLLDYIDIVFLVNDTKDKIINDLDFDIINYNITESFNIIFEFWNIINCYDDIHKYMCRYYNVLIKSKNLYSKYFEILDAYIAYSKDLLLCNQYLNSLICKGEFDAVIDKYNNKTFEKIKNNIKTQYIIAYLCANNNNFTYLLSNLNNYELISIIYLLNYLKNGKGFNKLFGKCYRKIKSYKLDKENLIESINAIVNNKFTNFSSINNCNIDEIEDISKFISCRSNKNGITNEYTEKYNEDYSELFTYIFIENSNVINHQKNSSSINTDDNDSFEIFDDDNIDIIEEENLINSNKYNVSSYDDNIFESNILNVSPDFVNKIFNEFRINSEILNKTFNINELKKKWNSNNVLYDSVENLAKICFVGREKNDADINRWESKLGIKYSEYLLDKNHLNSSVNCLYEVSKLKSLERSDIKYFEDAVFKCINSINTFEILNNVKEELFKIFNNIVINKQHLDHEFYSELPNDINSILSFNDQNDYSIKSKFDDITLLIDKRKSQFNKNKDYMDVYLKLEALLRDRYALIEKDSLLRLTIENDSCISDGYISCVIENIGYKDAEDVKASMSVWSKNNNNKNNIPVSCDAKPILFSTIYKQDCVSCKFKISDSLRNVNLDEIIIESRLSVSYKNSKKLITINKTITVKNVKTDDSIYENCDYTRESVTDENKLFGRKDDINKITRTLASENNDPIVLHGLKRVGKTSLLNYIFRHVNRDLNKEAYIPVYTSAQSIDEKNNLCKFIIQPTVEGIIKEFNDFSEEEINKLNSFLEFNYTNQTGKMIDFFKYLKDSNILRNKRVLLLVDELDYYFANFVKGNLINFLKDDLHLPDEYKVDQTFYGNLRYVIQGINSVRFIFCGADNITDIVQNSLLESIFETAKKVEVSFLNKNFMIELVKKSSNNKLQFSNKALDRIWYYTKGNPFYTKSLCATVLDILQDENLYRTTIYASDVNDACLNMEASVDYLDMMFNKDIPDVKVQKEIIKFICNNTRTNNDRINVNDIYEYIESCDIFDDTINIQKSLSNLVKKSILSKFLVDGIDYYNFTCEIFRLYYHRMYRGNLITDDKCIY